MGTNGSHDQTEIDASAQKQGLLEMLIVFRAGDLHLGIDVQAVREVTRPVPLSAPLSNARGVIGVIVLRGESVAVIDLNSVIGAAGGQRDRNARLIAVRHDGATVCLLVDEVEGLRDVTAAELESPPAVIADSDAWWLSCITHNAAGELVGVIDLERLLSRIGHARTEASVVSV